MLYPFHLAVAAGEDDIVGVAGCPVAGPLRTRLLEVLLEVRRVGQAGRDIGNDWEHKFSNATFSLSIRSVRPSVIS